MSVTYRYSRLTFKRDIIEPLRDDEYFRIETPAGTFEMTKRDFYREFRNVTRSASYLQKGLYNYSRVPERSLKFIINNESSVKSATVYALPAFLTGVCTAVKYKRWLHRKAMAHFKRDSKRSVKNISCALYKQAIHNAVLAGGKYDAYTGEPLDWSLISKYDNADSKAGKRKYKKDFQNCLQLTTLMITMRDQILKSARGE